MNWKLRRGFVDELTHVLVEAGKNQLALNSIRWPVI